jgi:hypothetical protein
VPSTFERLGLRVQETVSHVLTLPTYAAFEVWMRFGRGYRIPAIRQVRAEFMAQVGRERGPLLICANHLTLIDSLVILWALAPGWRFLVRRDLFAWNLPDRRNITSRWWVRVMGYLGKCIPVVRQGTPEQARRTIDQVTWLLGRGQSVMIFPEGGRSRVGRVDTANVTYGVGRILQAVPATRVLCVFLRGLRQVQYSNYPARDEIFFVRLKRIAPTTPSIGMRGARDLATQIVRQLSEMETEYLEDAGVDR